MYSTNVTFQTASGLQLAATLDLPDTPTRAYAIFAHGFGGSRHTPAASRTSKRLTEHGIGTLRFDFAGLGQSQGEFTETSLTSNVQDIMAAATWLADHHSAPQLLVGHSLGGIAALIAAGSSQLDSLRGVAVIGAPFDPSAALQNLQTGTDGDDTIVELAGAQLTLSASYLADVATYRIDDVLSGVRVPALVLQAEDDECVSIDDGKQEFNLLPQPASYVALAGADHLLTRQGSAHQAADAIGQWFHSHWEPEFTYSPLTPGIVVSHSARGTAVGNTVRSHYGATATDLPRALGGKGRGHSSTELFMMSVATATAEQIQAVAQKQGLVLSDVRVRVAHVHDKTFERRITITGDISDAQRAVLLRAAQGSLIEAIAAEANIMDVG